VSKVLIVLPKRKAAFKIYL